MRLKKIMVSLSVIVCLYSNLTAIAYAEPVIPLIDNGISLLYEIADAPSSNLSIVDRTAYCVSTTGGINAVSITVTQTLQKHKVLWLWDDVKGASWTGTNAYNFFCLSNSKSGLDSGTYRVESVFILTDKYGKTETITIYSDEEKVP